MSHRTMKTTHVTVLSIAILAAAWGGPLQAQGDPTQSTEGTAGVVAATYAVAEACDWSSAELGELKAKLQDQYKATSPADEAAFEKILPTARENAAQQKATAGANWATNCESVRYFLTR